MGIQNAEMSSSYVPSSPSSSVPRFKIPVKRTPRHNANTKSSIWEVDKPKRTPRTLKEIIDADPTPAFASNDEKVSHHLRSNIMGVSSYQSPRKGTTQSDFADTQEQ